MDSLMDTIFDFIRVRQLNIAVAGVMTLGYFLYQYWGTLMKMKGGQEEDEELDQQSVRGSRSRSRSLPRSRSRSGDRRQVSEKHRRNRKSHRRCPNCSVCNFGE